MDQDQIRDAAAAAVEAQHAIDGASRRRASAVTAAQDLIDNAKAVERAEQDAARTALAASIRRLLAQKLSISEIAAICRISPTTIRVVAATARPFLTPGHAPPDRRGGCHHTGAGTGWWWRPRRDHVPGAPANPENPPGAPTGRVGESAVHTPQQWSLPLSPVGQ